MFALLQEMSLKNLGSICLPTSAVTYKVAGEIAKLRKSTGVLDLKVMPYFPMATFLPTWASVSEAEEEAPRRRMMDMVSFLTSVDNFAVVYDAVGALDYSAAMGHKRHVVFLLPCGPFALCLHF